MLDKRLKEEKGNKSGKNDKIVKREICNMVTKGTFKDPNNMSYEPRFVLAFKRVGNDIGITFFDLGTLKIYVGQFTDDEHLSNFRTLIYQIRPVEVIHEREFSNSEIIKMMKNSPVVPAFSLMPPKNCWGVIKSCTNFEKYKG
jgi:DNA mismatch repair ATPase MutS